MAGAAVKQARGPIEGKPVLVVVDIMKRSFAPIPPGTRNWRMPGFLEAMARVPGLIAAARKCSVLVVSVQEAHRPELDMRPEEYFIRKRRYSVFFGTEFEILLKGLGARTLILTGGFTDVCVHYTCVDGHQHDYLCCVVEDGVSGSLHRGLYRCASRNGVSADRRHPQLGRGGRGDA